MYRNEGETVRAQQIKLALSLLFLLVVLIKWWWG